MSATHSPPALASPFPGLRPFKMHEEAIFFGRHEQISDTLRRLETCRLLAVVGASGCGKSSLVRAGLLPALKEGLLFDAGSQWKMATLRPGSDPYRELARALSETLPPPRAQKPDQWRSFIQAMLLSGDSGLIRVINEAGLPPGTNVLVLVDQFEELFRFRNPATRQSRESAEKQRLNYEQRNTANAFVNMLLETVCRQDGCVGASGPLRRGRMTSSLRPKHPIFVVLTMRSEFLGHCDAFLGLPEAVSESQFLTPRMTRQQLKEAIVRPLELFRAVAQPALVNRILNDVGTDPDALPLMQHALLRTWQNVTRRAAQQPPLNKQPLALEIRDYEKAGGLQDALSIHADEAYAELRDDPVHGQLYQHVAQRLFVLLCRQTGEGLLVRHPIRVAQAAEAIGVPEETVVRVAAAFCKEGRNFITPSGDDHELNADSTLDISHESLIRNWDTFRAWMKVEAKSAADYAWVLEAAKRWKTGGNLFQGANLRSALAWKERAKPTPNWTARYGGDFELAMRFLRESQKQHERWALVRLALYAVAVLALIFVVIQQRKEIDTQNKLWRTTAQLREIGQTAKLQSDAFAAQAAQLLKDTANPRAPALALAQLSRAIERDRTNFTAAETACTLLLKRTWCPPLTPPLRYSSDSAILAATFDPSGDSSRVLAVCQDGWLLVSDAQGASLVQKQRLQGAANAKKV
ncbi:MAG: ATP-binding protein, partial [Verrucomicrobia bacterium]|nr:ATP-binding protein [Verrucomicrobiota bacterium]